jgi:hypothetical protein
VRIKGTQGVTEELQCVADFSRIGEDAECTVKSSRNIGDIKCIIWRTSSSNGWAFDKVINLNYHDLYTEIIVNRDPRTNFFPSNGIKTAAATNFCGRNLCVDRVSLKIQ